MKMKVTRKILSLIAVFALLASLMTGAWAADTALTRGELAAKLVEGAGLSDQVAAAQAQPSAFTDVPEDSTYEGYINLVYSKGLMGGTGDGCFSPGAKVSQVEAITALMRYVDLPCNLLAAWPADYSKTAEIAGLTQGITYEAGGEVTGAAFQQMIINAKAILGRPVVGISWMSDDQDYTEDFHRILPIAGGVPFELPQITSYAMAQTVVASVDGIVVTGGEDINPDLYGDKHSPLLEDNNALRDLRDTSDSNLVKAAVEQDVPMLCICRGMQMLNVALGGGMIQDFPSFINTNGDVYTTHRMPAGTPDRDYARHDITIQDGSKWLETVVGGNSLASVASWHHQVLDPQRIGTGLTVVSYGPEDVIEAVEYQGNTFTLGIQFHPERDALGEDAQCDVFTCLNFFKTLVQYAGN